MKQSLLSLACLMSFLAPALAVAGGDAVAPPAGFTQIVERGRIASIDEPSFVPANKADMGDESWLLGVVINGQSRAYSLNLLNQHEVVNDSIDGFPFAAVW